MLVWRILFVNKIIILILSLTLLLSTASIAKTAAVKHSITFLEIGSLSCAPCRMMVPVMKEIEEHYKDRVVVVFYDISGTMGSLIAEKYRVRMIPTQVFLDDKGKEFFRHTGFYPASEIKKILNKKLGKNAGNI